jgi:hypothetical protein
MRRVAIALFGERNPPHTDQAWYQLDLFAGGRFEVQLADGQFVTEHTVYGSGRPIVTSNARHTDQLTMNLPVSS